jgi:uncharacterized protein (TIGR00725 family)
MLGRVAKSNQAPFRQMVSFFGAVVPGKRMDMKKVAREREIGKSVEEIKGFLPGGFCIGILGSTSFHKTENHSVCRGLGRMLSRLDDTVILTGGVTGVGETVGRSYYQERLSAGLSPLIFHILPHAHSAWDYGKTLFAGEDMYERREVLARIAKIYIAVEGGPGTLHEARTALLNQSTVIPVGKSGGASKKIYDSLALPEIHHREWRVLDSQNASDDEVVRALETLIEYFKSCYR